MLNARRHASTGVSWVDFLAAPRDLQNLYFLRFCSEGAPEGALRALFFSLLSLLCSSLAFLLSFLVLGSMLTSKDSFYSHVETLGTSKT